jgi:hypothetical protein
MSINLDTLHELLGKAVVDFGATFHAALVRVGDKLGLYKALAAGGPQTPAELAKRTATTERYVREWLCNQAAGGYVTYDAETGKFHLSEEQAFAMADENSPAFLPGMFQTALAAIFYRTIRCRRSRRRSRRLRSGHGRGPHGPQDGDHHHEPRPDRADVLQPRHRRHRQGPSGPRSRRARRRHGRSRRCRRHPVPPAQHLARPQPSGARARSATSSSIA